MKNARGWHLRVVNSCAMVVENKHQRVVAGRRAHMAHNIAATTPGGGAKKAWTVAAISISSLSALTPR